MSEVSRRERRVRTAEIAMKDRELNGLLDQDKIIIPSRDCEPNYLYFGEGRNIGRLAICMGKNNIGNVGFIGLGDRTKPTRFIHEYHIEDSEMFQGWKPYMLVKLTPANLPDHELANWLKQESIELQKARIEWLEAMPQRLKQAPGYSLELESENELLNSFLAMGSCDPQNIQHY